MRRSLAFSSMLLLGIGLGFVGARCGSPSSSPAEDSETVTAWTVERPRLGEHLRVEDIEPADLGDCIEARYRVVLTR